MGEGRQWQMQLCYRQKNAAKLRLFAFYQKGHDNAIESSGLVKAAERTTPHFPQQTSCSGTVRPYASTLLNLTICLLVHR